ncbi:MAG: adenylate/guanylate cyclase domain-containing protein [Treponema sp.]|nr:adenylate/guanylate cyclase domain-containing protein [Treponema sp.]
MKNVQTNLRLQVKFPLGVKLAIIIGTIVLVSLGCVTFLNSHFIAQDVRITAENNNLTINSRSAGTVEDKLSTIRSNVFQLLDLLNVVGGGRSASLARQAEAFFFERNQDIAAINILNGEDFKSSGEFFPAFSAKESSIINNRFFISNEIDVSSLENFIKASSQQINRSCLGETIALNASPFFNIPAMALLFPWKENGLDQTCVITFSIENMSDILGTDSVNTTFILNDSAEILCHPDTEKVLLGESYKNFPLVVAMRQNNESNADSRQIPFSVVDEKNKKTDYFGAYQKLSFGDIVVFTTVPVDSVLEGVRTTRTNNIYLTGIVFFLSVIIILVFTRQGISRHLRKLTEAAEEIKNGNFDTPVFNELSTKRKDEIGVLNQSTKDEREFLDVFAKFTNKGVAKSIARKELDFDPHLKDITIFFSDIRGFTAISDGFKNRFENDSPREIIGFLNDYMSRMVNCITLSHGNVDKFEGDAIMAVWGILREDNLDFEKLPDSSPEKAELCAKHEAHKKQDALNAIRGTIAMRYALMKYNKDAQAFTKAHENEPLAKYKPHIRIGCGLNSGRATCGIMGSEDKMEYTAIGDAVNFASRTESSNKPCGTDILITEDTYNLLKDDFIKNESNNFSIKEENQENEIVVEMIPVEFEVKGKGLQHFYGVVNMPGFDIQKFFQQGDSGFVPDEDCLKAVGPAGPKTMAQVRELLGIPVPDFEKVNLNEEENKIQIKK